MARNIDDPNMVTIVFAISDIDKAKHWSNQKRARKSDDGRSSGIPKCSL
jgi:hypothetical protein